MLRKRSRPPKVSQLLNMIAKSGILDNTEQNLVEYLNHLSEKNYPRELPQLLYEFGLKASSYQHFDLAIRFYEAAIQRGLENSEIYYNLGNAKFNSELYKDAQRFYSRALDFDPRFVLPYYNRGLSRLYQNCPEGIEDLIRAAELDCDFLPLYDALCRHGVAQKGYYFIYNLFSTHGFPKHARERLYKALESSLFSFHSYLLGCPSPVSWPMAENSVRIRCQLIDACTQKDSSLKCLQLLCQMISEARHAQDLEAEWRACYLLGMMAYIPVLVWFPPNLPMDIPDEFNLPSWESKEVENSLHNLIDVEAPELDLSRDEHRLAAFALTCFDRSVEILCARQPAPPSAGNKEGYLLNWEICENVFRELIRSCVYLKNPRHMIDGIEEARFFYHSTSLQNKQTSNIVTCLDKLKRHFGRVDHHQLSLALDDKDLLIDYYICEIVEDRLLFVAQSGSTSVAFEKDITVRPLFDAEPGLSLLHALLEANERWMSIEVRKAILEQAEKAYHEDPHHKSFLLAQLGKTIFSEWPRDPDPNLDALDDLLLGSIRGNLSTYHRIAIAPFSYLHNFPFHVLPSIQRLLDAETLESLVYTPSVRLFANKKEGERDSGGKSSCLFVGYAEHSDIAIKEEFEIVERCFPRTKKLIDEDATRENVLRHLPDFDVVHFCCHGQYDINDHAPFLDLADSRLFPQDILDLNQKVPGLVFANACISGSAPRVSRNGDQELGLHTAFLISGAKNVIGTLWHVDDKVALQFARLFYEQWTTDSSSITSEVFLHSQKALRKQHGTIGMWAPHALFGTWD